LHGTLEHRMTRNHAETDSLVRQFKKTVLVGEEKTALEAYEQVGQSYQIFHGKILSMSRVGEKRAAYQLHTTRKRNFPACTSTGSPTGSHPDTHGQRTLPVFPTSRPNNPAALQFRDSGRGDWHHHTCFVESISPGIPKTAEKLVELNTEGLHQVFILS
jgi:hypothetical protein